MTVNTYNIGQLYRLPFSQPLSPDGKTLPNGYRTFYRTNSTAVAAVFQDSAMTTPYVPPVRASATSTFSPIYLNPALEYRSQLFSQNGQMLEDVDTINNNTAGGPSTVTMPGAIAVAQNAGAPTGYARSASKAVTTSRSTLAVTADPDLSVFLPAAGTYKIDMDLVCTSSVAGQLMSVKTAFSGTMGAGATPTGTYSLMCAGTQNGAGAQNGTADPILLINFSSTITLDTVPVDNTMRFSGTIQTLTPGTLSFTWGCNAGGYTVSILAGSSLTALQVA
jgi:hypothetical protein